jgi:putative ABC transport system substrate-binding protein
MDHMAIDIGRRKFISALGGATFAWPLAARAQQPAPLRRLGVLMPEAETDAQSQTRRRALEQGLTVLGWTIGKNLQIEYRWAAGDPEQTKLAAAELMKLTPDVLLGAATPPVRALQQATTTIPIIFVGVTEPVAQGFIPSLAHPGGNLTGFTNIEATFGGKWLELLKEVAPPVTRALVMYNPEATAAVGFLNSLNAAAQKLSVALNTALVHQIADVETAAAILALEPGGGLIVLPDPFTLTHQKPVVEAAARHQLPAIYAFRSFAIDGGLVSYGVDIPDLFRLAAGYVDRILKGEKPADLPVQQPTKFELVINLKTAKALGLDVPPSLLIRADEVIE